MAPSEKSREHNQGRQDRDFTPEQKSAVDRVRKCKPTAYYEILDIETKASDGEVKKAYRRLALVMHPDKNGAPGADEAFKSKSVWRREGQGMGWDGRLGRMENGRDGRMMGMDG